MSLHSYLNDVYGPGTQEKKRKKKDKNKNSKKESKSYLNITESAQTIFPNSTAEASYGIKNKKKGDKNIWKNLDTNEVVTENQGIQNLPTEGQLSSGAYAGLQSAEDIDKQIKRKELLDGKMSSRQYEGSTTVFRDEKGRKVNDYGNYMKKEIRDEQLREAVKRQEIVQLNMGELQLYMKNGSKSQPTQDTKKKQLEFEDPASMFDPKSNTRNVKMSALGRRLYEKLYPMNRFEITPGWRWDGVDRSNGFEKKWFAKQNELVEKKVQGYTLQEDY